MKKKLMALALALTLACTSVAFAASVDMDYSALEGVVAYDEPIEISFARSVTATAKLDESNPRMKSYTENVWISTIKDALNVDVTFKWIASDSDSNSAKWGAAIASGNVPDAGAVSDVVYKQLLDAGMIADTTDLYENEVGDLLKGMITPELLDNMTSGGRLYGIPMPGPSYINNAVLFVRTDWLEKLGLEAPKTIDEALAIARAFKENKLGGDDTIGLMFADGDGANDGLLKGFMNGYGAYRDMWVEVDGKLAWSNTLPEMRESLLALQALYAEGLINDDFAVINGTVAQENVASGKCGIFYSADWAVTTSMQAAVDLDPNADFICVGIPGLTEDAQTNIQTGAIRANKLFISADCEHPEAIARMMNLYCALCSVGNDEWYHTFESGPNGEMYYKFLPWDGNHLQSAVNDITYAADARTAELTGEFTCTIPTMKAFLTQIYEKNQGITPDAPWWFSRIGGVYGSYTYDYDMYMSGRMIPNAFNTLPTDTMDVLGDVVDDALNVAMLEVIMGADISKYDEAVQSWFANGGQTITDEVNEWYASK